MLPQPVATVFIDLNEAHRLQASSLESKSEAPDAGEQLQDSQGFPLLVWVFSWKARIVGNGHRTLAMTLLEDMPPVSFVVSMSAERFQRRVARRILR